jgi:hypothetical protein
VNALSYWKREKEAERESEEERKLRTQRKGGLPAMRAQDVVGMLQLLVRHIRSEAEIVRSRTS